MAARCAHKFYTLDTGTEIVETCRMCKEPKDV